MRRRIFIGLGMLAVLLIGVGIGSSGNGKKNADNAIATTTVTITRTQDVTVARTRTTRAVPPACRDAIADARRVAVGAAAGFRVASKWPPMMSQAAQAGAAGDATTISTLAAELKSDTATLNAAASVVGVEALAFDSAAAHCR